MADTLPQEIGEILMLTVQDFHRRLEADLARREVSGIGKRHRAVFLHLGRYGASRSVDLARAAGIRPQSMMSVIHELEAMGLIERRPDPADSRAKLIDFSERGRQFIAELSRSTRAVWRQYEAVLGREQLTAVFRGLQDLNSTLDAQERLDD